MATTEIKAEIPKLMANLEVRVRATGSRRAVARLNLMRMLIAFAALVGGVRHIDVDSTYQG